MINNNASELAKTELQKALSRTRKSFLYVGIFSFFVNMLMLTPAIYMLQMFDRVLTSRSIETLILITIIMAVMFATMFLLEVARSRILVRIGNKIDLELSPKLFDTIFLLARLSPSQASSQPINDFTKLRQFVTGQGVFAFFDSPWFPIYVFVMYLFSPWFAAFAIFAAIVLFTITMINEKTTKDAIEEANIVHSRSIGYINKNIFNAEVVHAMGMNDNLRRRWLKKHIEFLSIQSGASDTAGKWTNLSKTLRQFFQALTYGIGTYLVIIGDISAGMLIAGAILLGRALAPLDLLTGTWKSFIEARGAYKRLNDLLRVFPEIPETMDLPVPKGEVRIENIVVAPPGVKTPVIKGINMSISAGETIAIIGPSASGKSTLARAMLGVWPLLNGKVRLDGADIHQWDSVKLGSYVGYLPQDVELFEGTVSENICRFKDVDADKVIEAAKIAGVHQMILMLPDGYDTVIGAGGTTLSGGQRQRVGLARAVYNKPPFIVLDEPNSNLDESGESALVDAILSMKKSGSTIVLITHRPSILNITDRIAIINDGVLSMYDTKDRVLKALQDKVRPQISKNTNSSVIPKMTKPGE